MRGTWRFSRWAGLCGAVTVTTPNDGSRSANLMLTGGVPSLNFCKSERGKIT